MKTPPVSALAWCKAGTYFSWKSSLPENATYRSLHIFNICIGNPENPAVVLIHGYPTSSYDFSKLAQQLSNDFHVCALDTPGYGFSDKPKNGYHYSIFDDARLVDDYIRDTLKLKEFTLVTHDKGDSVGLALLQIYQAYPVKPYTIRHQFITNGNIFLPLAQLTTGQKMLLNPLSGPILSALIDGSWLIAGLANTTYSPALPTSEMDALASIFDYQGGAKIEYNIIQYLNERKRNEVIWLNILGRSDIPTTLIWGKQDEIAPTSVPDYVWVSYLQGHTASNYWQIPCANHYIQVDQPQWMAAIIRSTLASVPYLVKSAESCQPSKIN
ncbi:MAG: alpha/beta hydrolase [Chloroflexota bacterium]